MADADRVTHLAALLREAGSAHHQAYRHAGGEDPEWPIWYAGWLYERIGGLFSTPVTRSELTYLLVAAERARGATDPGGDWPTFYARFILEQRS
jgi:hypothetical protein